MNFIQELKNHFIGKPIRIRTWYEPIGDFNSNGKYIYIGTHKIYEDTIITDVLYEFSDGLPIYYFRTQNDYVVECHDKYPSEEWWSIKYEYFYKNNLK